MKILLIGNGPLKQVGSGMQNAYSIRTQMYFDYLKKQNFNFRTILLSEVTSYKNFNILETNLKGRSLKNFIQKEINNQKPDVIISVNNLTSYIVSKLKFTSYFIADLNGFLLGEVQLQNFYLKHDNYLQTYIQREKQIIQKADKLVSCSLNQKKALVGELALMGKLNSQNFGKNLISNVANYCEAKMVEDTLDLKLPKNAITIGWLSGFNNWVDEKTLFEILKNTMQNNPNLYFVCTGGKYKDMPNGKFEYIYKNLKKAKLLERCRFLNFVDNRYLQSVINCFDIAINTDLDCIESNFGARNRITELLANKIPVITTDNSEISSVVSLYNLGLSFGNSEKQDAIDYLNNYSKEVAKKLSKNFKRYFKENTLEIIMQEIGTYLKAPFKAMNTKKKNSVFLAISYLKEKGIKQFFKRLFNY